MTEITKGNTLGEEKSSKLAPGKDDALQIQLGVKDCLADVLGMQGRKAEGEALLREVLETRRTVLGQGPDHPDVRRTMNNLAGLLPPEKDDENEELCRQVLDADMKEYGDEHASTITSMNNMAHILSVQGKHDEAEALMRHAVRSGEIVYGPYHVETIDLVDNLRGLLRGQGKTEEAKEMLRERPSLREKVIETQMQPDGQEEKCRKALAACQTDAERVGALRNLAIVLEKKGRFSDAEAALEQLIQLSAETVDGVDRDLNASRQNRGVLMRRQGKFKEAETVFRSLLET